MCVCVFVIKMIKSKNLEVNNNNCINIKMKFYQNGMISDFWAKYRRLFFILWVILTLKERICYSGGRRG